LFLPISFGKIDLVKIVFTIHAEQQLKERNINLRDVEATIKNPDQVVEGHSFGRKVAQKVICKGNKKFLYRTVFKKENEKWVIITVYRTTNLERYSKEA
jgi:hypothetical protein